MPDSKPNVLVILADDLGWFDLSCFHHGLMGGRTRNIDRIAAAGAALPTSTPKRAARQGGRRRSRVSCRCGPG
jgi:arylsulfatase A-like enzyme